jgi:ribose-phosphate pyrophosphokinase
MEVSLIAGSSNVPLARSIAAELALGLCEPLIERFPDSELHVELHASVRGHDVYLIQSTSAPVDEHLIELLMLADACRRAGAGRLTAVVPYFGYARQDRRGGSRTSVGGRLVADLLLAAGIERLVSVDLHNAAMEGFFSIPVEQLSAVDLLVEALRPQLPKNAMIVAPDFGAIKLAERYAAALQLPLAIIHKTRLSPTEVRVGGTIGETVGKCPVVVGDMISTAGTIEAACQKLSEARELTVAATHAVLSSSAVERLNKLGIVRLVVTDSVPLPAAPPAAMEVVGLAPLIAGAIQRLHG